MQLFFLVIVTRLIKISSHQQIINNNWHQNLLCLLIQTHITFLDHLHISQVYFSAMLNNQTYGDLQTYSHRIVTTLKDPPFSLSIILLGPRL